MKTYVKSAEYKYYNANSRGNNVGDCVKRSISLAFDVPYTKVTKDINQVLKDYIQVTHRWDAQWNQTSVWSRLVKAYGGSSRVDVPEHPTEDEFADTHDGTYIVLSGKFSQSGNGNRRENHACCIIDHVIYDSWDSKNHRVYAYYKISDSGQHKSETNIRDRFEELGNQARSLMESLSLKYINKYNIHGGYLVIDNDIYEKGYAFKCKGSLNFSDSVEESKYLQPYDLSFTVVLTPTTDFEEAQEIVKKTVYQKIYDKFYYIRKDIESKKEAYDLQLAADGDGSNDLEWLWMDGREKRFLKSLPAWVSSFITYIDIQNPNQYSDSVRVSIRPLPGDPNKNGRRVEFEAYNASQMRNMLERYKRTYERPWDDYNPEEEY